MKRILFALMMVGVVGGLQACAMKQDGCGCGADGQCKTSHGKKAKKSKAVNTTTSPTAAPAKK